MNSKEITIDTYVLYEAASINMEAHALLVIVMRNHCIVLDPEGEILKQYTRCFSNIQFKRLDGAKFVKTWFKHVKDKSRRIVYYTSKLDARHERALNNMNFHDDDFPFVAVCSHSRDKLLVTEDEDYTAEIKNYLQNHLQTKVLTITDALNHL